jgi:succinoglycan biosynthesis transport protein ExoP
MKLSDYLTILKRRKWLIAAAVVAATLVAGLITARTPATYSAAATLRVATPASLANAGVLGTTDYLDRLQNTYAKLARSPELRDQLAAGLGLSKAPGISVTLRPNTELMDINATAGSASLAAAAANADARLLISRVRQLGEQSLRQADEEFKRQLETVERQIADARAGYEALLARGAKTTADRLKLAQLKTQIEVNTTAAAQQQSVYQTNRASLLDRSNLLSVVAEATTPTSPSGPNLKLALGLGMFVGLIAGLGLAFLFENLRTRIEAPDEIEDASGLPVLASIPASRVRNGPLFNSGSPTEDAFRRLRTNILALRRGEGGRVFLVTSAEPNEGKSTIVSNLGASLAQTGLEVVLVDADLRVPTLHKIFDVPNVVGFGNVLDGKAPLEDAVTTVEGYPGLNVLPSDGPHEHPAELLASAAAGKVFDELANRFDVVLVDSPAVLALADALSLATEAHDVLVVVSRAKTRREDLISVKKQLIGIGANPLGVIVNRAESGPSYHHYNRT